MRTLNKKGFTLIELLAVIVILAILVTVSVPAVTKYLGTARRGTFADNAMVAISAVRNDVITSGITTSGYYQLNTGHCSITTATTQSACVAASGVWFPSINELLEKKLTNSPFGEAYNNDSRIYVTVNTTTGLISYGICIRDVNHKLYRIENAVIDENVVDNTTACSATAPTT